MSDLSTTSWSEVDASNSQTPPEGWPAGMFANAVEPSARMNMGAMKRFWNRVNPTYLATLTTTDTYAVAETQPLAGYGLFEIRRTRFPAANVSSSPTVNHSTLGAIFLRKYSAAGAVVNLASGDIQAKDHEYWYDGTQMIVTNPASIVPGTTNKASPTSSDSMVITDAAASGAQKIALLSTIPALFPSKASPTSSDSLLITDAAAGSAGKTALVSAIVASAQPVLSSLSNSLSGDVNLTNTALYFDGPSVAQGVTGTWLAMGTVTVSGNTNDVIRVKLWDGTTVIASTTVQIASGSTPSVSLSGFLASPAGNIRISVKNATSTAGSAIQHSDADNSKDATITAVRIA